MILRKLFIYFISFICSSFLCIRQCDGWTIYNNDPRIDSDLKCANIYDTRSYQGRKLDFGDNDKLQNLQYHNFRVQSVAVKPGCSLSVFGEQGHKKLFETSEEWVWGWNHKLAKSCCECNGCSGWAANEDLACAKLYQHERCNGCFGFRLHIYDGDDARSFNILDNMMKSVVVRPGCTLTVYDDPNFGGYRYNFTGSHDILRENWHSQISSAQCRCGGNNPITTQNPITTTIREVITWKPTIITEKPTTTPTPITRPTTEKDSLESEEFPGYGGSHGGTEIGPSGPLSESEEDFTTTRAPATLPTVPATTRDSFEDSYEEFTTPRAPITLPTVPTTTQGSFELEDSDEDVTTTPVPITLPTVPTTTEDSFDDDSDEDDDDDYYDEDVTTTTTRRSITLPTVPTIPEVSFFGGDSDEVPTANSINSESEDFLSDEDEEDDIPVAIVRTTTTTSSSFFSDEVDLISESKEELVVATTRRTTTTTTTESAREEKEEESDEDDFW